MTFLLDTNVVSELRRRDRADPVVVAWADTVPVAQFYMSAITLLELELGILRMERRDARKGETLRAWLEGQILPRFDARTLAIDTPVALACARLHVPDPRSERDALIAANVLCHRMTVVTRNTPDFAATGVSLLDPWKA